MKKRILLGLRIITAFIFIQTLYFKFTASPESVYIFSALGLEPYGRIGSGIGELIAAVLLFYSPTVVLGAILSIGIISGAIFSHLTVIGIVVQDDGGLLFGLAVVVLIFSVAILFLMKKEFKELLNKYIFKKGEY